jgi:hypothetical protein
VCATVPGLQRIIPLRFMLRRARDTSFRLLRAPHAAHPHIVITRANTPIAIPYHLA